MVVLPMDEDAWLFRGCLYVGMAMLVLDVIVPGLFRHRLRLVTPTTTLRLPRVPVMTKDRFRQKKRELKAQIRVLESAEDVLSDTTRPVRSAKTKTRAKGSRVVLHGERDIDDPLLSSDHRLSDSKTVKHVSFQATTEDKRTKIIDSMASSYREQQRASPSPRRQTMDEEPTLTTTTSSTDHGRMNHASTEDAPTTASSTRPVDAFSLMDDDFPWQLPNYAKMVAETKPPTVRPPPPPAVAPRPYHEPIFNVRRPLADSNAAPSEGSLLFSTRDLELRQKPSWTNHRRESVEGNAGHNTASSTRSTADQAAQVQSSAPPVVSSSIPAPRLLFRQDEATRPSPTEHHPSQPPPRPPLVQRPAQVVTKSTLAAETPVPVQPKLRTPKIIRRITFDEDMMSALATPQEPSPRVPDSTRKRQRDQDIEDALEAVGLPWHKRRLHSPKVRTHESSPWFSR